MSDDVFKIGYLLTATDEEWDFLIGCAHKGKTYTEAGPLTGHPHVRCADCHSVIHKPANPAS